jgi:uncharacterized membrane protein YhaH (DUF805 family)
MNWYLMALKKYVDFSGRSRRKEYWMFFLFNIIIAVVLGIIEGILGIAGVISGLYCLAILLPGIAVTIRRLHDTDRSGWWILVGLVPIIGGLVLLFFMIQDGKPGENQYGPNPKGA